MTSVFIIGGFNIHYTIAKSEKIKLLENELTAREYNVILADISWRRQTLTQFCIEFEKLYQARRTGHNIIIGNSFGAIVALAAGRNVTPDKLYLCSLSAFFREDRQTSLDDHNVKRFGKRRMDDLWSLSFKDIAKAYDYLDTEIIITYGEKEKVMHPLLVRRCEKAAAELPHTKLIELPGAGHSMGEPVYTKELLKYV